MQLTSTFTLAVIAFFTPSSALAYAYYPLYRLGTGTAPYYPTGPTGTGTGYYPTGTGTGYYPTGTGTGYYPTGTGTAVYPTGTGTATIGTGYVYPTAALKRVARRAEIMDGGWA